MTAATSRIISVTSCSASHTNCKKVLGFLGGIKFCPNTVFRFSMSPGCPLKPVRERKKDFIPTIFISNGVTHINTWHFHLFQAKQEKKTEVQKGQMESHKLVFQWNNQVTKGWIRFRHTGAFVSCGSVAASTADTLNVCLAQESFIVVLGKLSGTTHSNASTLKVQLYIQKRLPHIWW